MEIKFQKSIYFTSETDKVKQENSTEIKVFKVVKKHANQVLFKKEKFELNFTKFDGNTNTKDDSSVEETHDTINVDEFRMN